MERIIRSTSVVGVRRLSERRDAQRSARVPKSEIVEQQPAVDSDAHTYDEGNANDADFLPIDTEIEAETNYLNSVWEREKQVVESLQKENRDLAQEIERLNELLRQMHVEIADSREQGFQTGIQQGYEEGREQGRGEYDDLKQQAESLIDLLKQSVRTQIAGVEDLSVEIALAALCRIVEEKFADEEFVISAVRNVIQNIAEQPSMVVRVNPFHLDILANSDNGIKTLMKAKNIKVVPDARVVAGGCLLETDHGNWDGRIETQLQKLFDLASKSENSKTLS